MLWLMLGLGLELGLGLGLKLGLGLGLGSPGGDRGGCPGSEPQSRASRRGPGARPPSTLTMAVSPGASWRSGRGAGSGTPEQATPGIPRCPPPLAGGRGGGVLAAVPTSGTGELAGALGLSFYLLLLLGVSPA